MNLPHHQQSIKWVRFVKLELDNPNFRHTNYLPTFHVASSITRVVFPFIFSKTDPGPWERFFIKGAEGQGQGRHSMAQGR